MPALGLPLFPGRFRHAVSAAVTNAPKKTSFRDLGHKAGTGGSPITLHMMISDQQARLALNSLHTTRGAGAERIGCPMREVPNELLERVTALLSELPETRVDRVAQARADIEDQCVSSGEVADKIIARIISDSLR